MHRNLHARSPPIAFPGSSTRHKYCPRIISHVGRKAVGENSQRRRQRQHDALSPTRSGARAFTTSRTTRPLHSAGTRSTTPLGHSTSMAAAWGARGRSGSARSRTGTSGLAAAPRLFDRDDLTNALLRDVGLARRARPICGRNRRFHTKNELADTPVCSQNWAMLSPLAGCRSIRSCQNCSRSWLAVFAIAQTLRDRNRSSNSSSLTGAPRMAFC